MKPLPSTTTITNKSNSFVTDQDTIDALLADARAAATTTKTAAADAVVRKGNGNHQTLNGKSGNNSSNNQNSSKGQYKRPRDDHYGPNANSEIKDYSKKLKNLDDIDNEKDEEEVIEKQKPNFGLSGALMGNNLANNRKDGGIGTAATMYRGVILKFQEPPDARTPNTQWRLYVFKNEQQIDTLHISKQSAYLFGRNSDIADIHIAHLSLSSQHAVLQYRAVPHKDTGKITCQPYLLDLESTNGSFINGIRIDPARYYQLKKGDVITFGSSTREYVLIAA